LRDVNNPDAWSNPVHHCLADTDRIILDVKIGEEANGAQGRLSARGGYCRERDQKSE
jgi:hypothetical protein